MSLSHHDETPFPKIIIIETYNTIIRIVNINMSK